MKKTKTTEENSTFKGIFTSEPQAKIALREIFKKSDDDSLSNQLFDLVVFHPDPVEINRILDEFKPLVSTFEMNDLLTPGSKIEGWENNACLRPAIAIGLSLLFVDICWNVFGQKLHKEAENPWVFDESSKETQILRMMANYIKIDVFIIALFDTLTEAVGKSAYDKFKVQISQAGSNREKYQEMDANSENDPKVSLMIFMGWFRTLVEATFYLLHEEEVQEAAD